MSSTATIQADRLQAFRGDVARLCDEIGRVVIGQRAAVEGAVLGLLAGGHVLLEGPPGVGKTLLARTLADATELTFRRIQFTPDLMGADVIGTYVVMESAGRRKFEFQQGPLFANVVLADEINRATPKTQSALLEGLQEFAVTVANETYELPQPFFVIATQGPDDGDGTFPLPEKQLDRFLCRLMMQRPAAADMETVIDRATGTDEPAARPVLGATRIVEMTELVRQVALDPAARKYAVRLVAATDPQDASAPPLVKRYVRQATSPRAALALVLLAKARAAAAGRDRATTDDVRAHAAAVLAHRLVLNFDGLAERITAEKIAAELSEFNRTMKPDPEFFQQCEGFRAAARRAWGSRRFGRRNDGGPMLAGTEASDTADYATGDDYRRVDWHRAARLDELVSRLFRGVEIGTLHIVLDNSASMRVGSPTKSWFASNLAQTLGCLALMEALCVQVDQARFAGQREMARMCSAIEESGSGCDNAAFLSAVASVGKHLRRGDQLIVLSDLLSENAVINMAVSIPCPSQQLVIIQVLAPEDLEPEYLQRVRLRDVESGAWLGAELFDEDLTNYRETAEEFRRELRRQCAARAIPLVQLRTDAGLVRGMEQLIHIARLPANLH